MKFSEIRRKRKKELKEARKLVRKLSSLNDTLNCSFELNKNNFGIIYSKLKRDNLPKLKLPGPVYYVSSYLITYIQGFVTVTYNGRLYKIYAEGFGLD